jgi:hypothetical protein
LVGARRAPIREQREEVTMRVVVCALLCALFFSATAGAGSVTTLTDPGTTQVTTALAGFSTFGGNATGTPGGPGVATNDMNGMTLTATFADGSSETVAWNTTGAFAGGAFGTGWSMTLSGDTYWPAFSDFLLNNDSGKTMARLVLDGGPGDTVFDRFTNTSVNNSRTLGSADGGDFILFEVNGVAAFSSGSFNTDGTLTIDYTPSPLNITATYRNAVALSGNAPLFDLWRVLDISFDNGLRTTMSIEFGQDTDNLSISGDIREEPIPEPGTLALLSLGAVGLVLARRRRKS